MTALRSPVYRTTLLPRGPEGGPLVTAGRIYVREVPGARGHVLVGISTAYLGRLEHAETRAFGRMIAPGSLATFKARRSRWERMRAAVNAARASWERVWGLS